MSATDPAPRPPRRRARADRTKAALVNAALSLFASKGIEATAVDEITDAAGVAKGTFYVHFRRKQDVLLEHAADMVEAAGAAEGPDTTSAALGELCGALASAFADAAPAVRGPMVRELLGHPARWARVAGEPRTLTGALLPVLARGQEAGEVRGDQPAGLLARRLAVLLLDALSAAQPPATQAALTEDLQQAVSLFLDGAAARRAG